MLPFFTSFIRSLSHSIIYSLFASIPLSLSFSMCLYCYVNLPCNLSNYLSSLTYILSCQVYLFNNSPSKFLIHLSYFSSSCLVSYLSTYLPEFLSCFCFTFVWQPDHIIAIYVLMTLKSFCFGKIRSHSTLACLIYLMLLETSIYLPTYLPTYLPLYDQNDQLDLCT